MATTPERCIALVRAAERRDRALQICHVLRYAPFFRAVYDIVRSGRLGEIVSVDWRENLVYWHLAHSFIRGRWANTARRPDDPGEVLPRSRPADLDPGRRCERISSFGSLTHFRPERQRRLAGALHRRLLPGRGVRVRRRRACTWSRSSGSSRSRRSARSQAGRIRRALETGPYGRCVYRCDNDVVDHQVVVMQLERRTRRQPDDAGSVARGGAHPADRRPAGHAARQPGAQRAGDRRSSAPARPTSSARAGCRADTAAATRA